MASTELSGVQAFSVYDPSTGNVVQVDGKYVETFDFTQQRGGTEGPASPTGGSVSVGDFSEVEIVFVDVAGKSQLETWRTNDTPVSLVAAGEQAAIQWYETDIISELEEQPVFDQHADLNRYRFVMRRQGHGIHDIYKGTNLLRAVNHQVGSSFLNDSWQDSDSSGVADGYSTNNNTSNESFGSDVQSFDTASNGNASHINATIEFPVSGVDLTLSSNLTQLHSSEDDVVKINFFDSNNSGLSASSTTVSSTGRASVTNTTPSSIFDLRVDTHRVNNSSTTETVKHKLPALRLDGGTSHVEH